MSGVKLTQQNDLILGYCAYQVLAHNDRFFAHHLPAFAERFLANDIISALKWLDDWPVGLKLNTPLSQFFCSNLSAVLESWEGGSITTERCRV